MRVKQGLDVYHLVDAWQLESGQRDTQNVSGGRSRAAEIIDWLAIKSMGKSRESISFQNMLKVRAGQKFALGVIQRGS